MYPSAPQGFAKPHPAPPYGTSFGQFGALGENPAQLGSADGYQPDLTGSWRGSGGEKVAIQRNRARIWGGSGGYQSCTCVFFLVGQRLIAYSPDSDMVRKYWFKQLSGDRFTLVDEAGNRMTFWRVR
jgi:hypothetical protein